VSAALNARKEEEALEALQILVELADLEPTFLRPHLVTVVNAMLTIANTNQLGDRTRTPCSPLPQYHKCADFLHNSYPPVGFRILGHACGAKTGDG